jgi:hypothetical protein
MTTRRTARESSGCSDAIVFMSRSLDAGAQLVADGMPAVVRHGGELEDVAQPEAVGRIADHRGEGGLQTVRLDGRLPHEKPLPQRRQQLRIRGDPRQQGTTEPALPRVSRNDTWRQRRLDVGADKVAGLAAVGAVTVEIGVEAHDEAIHHGRHQRRPAGKVVEHPALADAGFGGGGLEGEVRYAVADDDVLCSPHDAVPRVGHPCHPVTLPSGRYSYAVR